MEKILGTRNRKSARNTVTSLINTAYRWISLYEKQAEEKFMEHFKACLNAADEIEKALK